MRVRQGLFRGALLASVAVGLIALGALLVRVVIDGWRYLDWMLISNPPSSDSTVAGARPAILATLELMAIVIAFGVPVGVGTAIYLEEFADGRRWYNRLLEINIQNLAAVPSIVYGILGLGFLVHGANLGRVVLAGGLILTLLVLPTIIIAVARGDPERAAGHAARRVRARRDAVAGRLAAGAAGGHPGHRDRVDPRALARDRRVGSAAPRRRAVVRPARPDAASAASSPCPCRSTTGCACRRRSSTGSRRRRSSCCSSCCSR